MSGFEAYKEYVALKNHFTKPHYDYVKYNGHSRVKSDSFNKRKDKIFFEKLAKHPDIHGFLLANLSSNAKSWIRDLAYSDEADRCYKNWLNRNQSLTYNYKNDFKKIVEEPKQEGHPAAMRLYLGGEISLESLCIFVDVGKILETWDSKLEYDPVWEDLRMKIVKYTPFVKYDQSNIKKIMIDILDDMGYTK
jgi:hypothetical protein